MNCSPYDLKDYILGELSRENGRLVEEHAGKCRHCREELERLRFTRAALDSLPDEEIPRRIAFVSDKVFEASWLQRLWASGPRLGFASAIMLSAAIVLHAFLVRPGPAPAAPDAQVIQARVEAEVSKRVESAVRSAVAADEAQQAKKAAELVAAAERKLEFQRRADLVTFEENLSYLQKQMNVRYMASADMGDAR
jgi:anti-sigma factor RsiW